MTVMALAAEGDEEFSGLAGAGVGADAAKGVYRPLLHQGAARYGQNFRGGEHGSHQR